MRIFLFIFAALVAAGGTGFYLFRELQAPAQPALAVVVEAPKTKDVFVPAVQLAAGSILRPDHLGRMSLAEAALTPEMIVADDAGAAFLTGSVARQVLHAGVPIARTATVQPGDRGFLAAVLPQGKRAISIPISETAGLSGLVQPGDRVDMILIYSVSGSSIDAERDIRASETVVTNLRVLALDHRLSGSGGAVDADGQIVAPPIARTATLEVTPQQAEMITLATTLGDLSLVLNSVRDGGEPGLADARRPGVAPGAGAMTEPLVLASSARLDARGSEARHMTLDSDVTSLLRREATDGAAAAELPKVPMVSRVQIVRGTSSNAVDLSAATPDAATAAATLAATTLAAATPAEAAPAE